MARLTKQDVIDQVSESTGLTKKDSNAALNAVLGTIQSALANGDSVGLIGFGTFEIRERAARDGRNPQTGAPIRIPAKKVPAFRAGKALKEAI
jgi:DNA-binding protein HU-beta